MYTLGLLHWTSKQLFLLQSSSGESENTVTFPRSINYRNQIIYFDPKKKIRIVIKKILNYYHHGEKCGKLLVGMSEKSKRVSEK